MAVPPDPDNIVRLVVSNAQEVTEMPAKPVAAARPAAAPTPSDREPPPMGDAPGGDNGDGARGGRIKLGNGSFLPIVPLGVAGDNYFYLDANRQLRTLGSKDHGRLGVYSLLGAQAEDIVYKQFPRFGRDGVSVTGWRAEKMAEVLMAECSSRGIWNADERERGRGAWLDGDGRLVLHCGDTIWFGGTWRAPGAIYGGHVYPAAPSVPRPAKESTIRRADGGETSPAELLLALLRTWKWKRPETDPELLLGWICAAMIGGALDWRPMIWITGGAGTGKTTLQKAIALLFDGGLISISDTTAAGIWQKLGKASLPVALDEQEAEEDNRKQLSVIKLARLASSGGILSRGGASHQGAEFQARSCFLFSSILVPPLSPQDRSRMAILELDPLASTAPPALEPRMLAAIGAALRKRLLDQWPRMGDTLHAYRASLAAKGHGGRGCDQFGTICAALDLAQSDDMPTSDALDLWADRLEPSEEEASEEAKDHIACANRLLTSVVDVFRGGKKRTVAEWVEQAIGRHGNQDTDQAAEALAVLGLRVERDPVSNRWSLVVANKHQGLEALFAGSKWAGTSGTMGVWVQSLRRIQGAMPVKSRFAGLQLRATSIPLIWVMPDAALMAQGLTAPDPNPDPRNQT